MTAKARGVEDPEDDSLVQMVLRGPGTPEAVLALARLYLKWLAILTAYGRWLVGDEAEDIAQETLVQVFTQKLHRFQYRGPGSFARWLFTVMRHACLNYQTAQRRRAELDTRWTADEEDEKAAAAGLETLVARQETEIKALLVQAGLAEHEQQIVRQRVIEGRKPEQIAPEVGLSAAQVSRILYRAKRQLQAYMTACRKEGTIA